jgi:hypothetical protein
VTFDTYRRFLVGTIRKPAVEWLEPWTTVMVVTKEDTDLALS